MLTVKKAKGFGFTHFTKVDEGTIVVSGSDDHKPMAMENSKGVQTELRKAGLKRAKEAPADWDAVEPKKKAAKKAPAKKAAKKAPKAKAAKKPAEPKVYASRSTVVAVRDVSNLMGRPPLYFDSFENYREIVWKELNEDQAKAAAKLLNKTYPKARYTIIEGRLCMVIPRASTKDQPIEISYAKNISILLTPTGDLVWGDEQGGKFKNTSEFSKEDLAEVWSRLNASLRG